MAMPCRVVKLCMAQVRSRGRSALGLVLLVPCSNRIPKIRAEEGKEEEDEAVKVVEGRRKGDGGGGVRRERIGNWCVGGIISTTTTLSAVGKKRGGKVGRRNEREFIGCFFAGFLMQGLALLLIYSAVARALSSLPRMPSGREISRDGPVPSAKAVVQRKPAGLSMSYYLWFVCVCVSSSSSSASSKIVIGVAVGINHRRRHHHRHKNHNQQVDGLMGTAN